MLARHAALSVADSRLAVAADAARVAIFLGRSETDDSAVASCEGVFHRAARDVRVRVRSKAAFAVGWLKDSASSQRMREFAAELDTELRKDPYLLVQLSREAGVAYAQGTAKPTNSAPPST
jgi:hypothetical protein